MQPFKSSSFFKEKVFLLLNSTNQVKYGYLSRQIFGGKQQKRYFGKERMQQICNEKPYIHIHVPIIFRLLMHSRMFTSENRLNIGILKYNSINKSILNIKALLPLSLINTNLKQYKMTT